MKDQRKKISFVLPWPPSMNHYWRRVVLNGRPQTLISKEGIQYRATAIKHVVIQRCNWQTTTGRVGVSIQAHPPDARKRDLDNLLKPLLDALTHAKVWKDDEQIDALTITRADKVDNGRLLVEVCQL